MNGEASHSEGVRDGGSRMERTHQPAKENDAVLADSV